MDKFWKNKKVTAYIALKHHTRFIIPIMENLARLGAKIHYVVAQAERSQEITAIETGLNYYHIFDFISDSDHEEIHKNYQILKNGFASSLLKDTAFGLQVPTVMDKTLYATAQEYTGFKNYFKKNRPNLCLALHEVNRWGKMFSFHAKKNNIPCITLQEGLLTTASAKLNFTMTGHVQYSTLGLVWGEESKKLLASFEAPEAKIIPAGNTHLSKEILRLRNNRIREKTRKKYTCGDALAVLLIFSVYLPDLDEFLPLFNLSGTNPDMKLFIKFHPASTKLQIENWMKKFPEDKKDLIRLIHGEENTYDLMAMSDVCVLTEGSTTGLEALSLKKPVVILKLVGPVYHESSLAEQKAAVPMTPAELTDAINNHTDFSAMMDPEGINAYIKSELHNPEKSIETVTDIMKSVVKANAAAKLTGLTPKTSSETDWSIVIPVPDNPGTFLQLLEAVSAHSEEENFEVILIRPKNISVEIKTILESLEGDVKILETENKKNTAQMMNLAGMDANGRYFIFLDYNISPAQGWLKALKQGISKYGTHKIFGARVINRFNNIIHAGMVVNANNEPVSAYAYLDDKFPHVMKERSFQMVNHFLCIERKQFFSLGGFNPEAGKYLFMDLCLRSQENDAGKNLIMYLPQIKLTQLSFSDLASDIESAIFFFSRWHGMLWESEDQLYKKDGVSSIQLSAARMTRAMETANQQ